MHLISLCMGQSSQLGPKQISIILYFTGETWKVIQQSRSFSYKLVTRVKLRVFAYKEITEQQADSPFLPTLRAPPNTPFVYNSPRKQKEVSLGLWIWIQQCSSWLAKGVRKKSFVGKKGEEAWEGACRSFGTDPWALCSRGLESNQRVSWGKQGLLLKHGLKELRRRENLSCPIWPLSFLSSQPLTFKFLTRWKADPLQYANSGASGHPLRYILSVQRRDREGVRMLR